MASTTDKGRDDLMWFIMVAGLILGAILTFFGLASEMTMLTVIGIIFLAFGGAAMFMRLNQR